MEEQRLDKWLWCARFFKTRSLAAEAIKAGRATVNGARAKPARVIKRDDQVMLRRPPFEYHLTVLAVARQRVGASLTRELYSETEASRQQRVMLAQSIKDSAVIEERHPGKLSKKNRREREKIKRFV
ncbi:MAG: RNA-binding S4 domain-containing protein [Proteobacteria bacterium]|nr:RNA-binding S4 domain-containing protein [Pseudomonadota bacterium]